MADLIILIGNDPNDPWEWGITGSGEAGLAETDDAKADLKNLDFSRVCAVVPGMHVVTKLHTLENLSDKQKRQAAGFSIEDELGASLDATHFALDPNAPRMAITSGAYLQKLIDTFAQAGLSPDLICADYDSFSWPDSFSYDGRVIQRAGNGTGFAIEADLAKHVLDAEQGVPTPITSQQFLQNISEAWQKGYEPINLRQGDFAKSNNFSFGKFKRSALLAAAVVIAFVAVNIGQGVGYGNKTKQMQTEIGEIYAQIFPETDIPDNPVLPVIRAQASAKTEKGAEFIKLSAILTNSVKQIKGVEISSLRYDQARGQLVLSINYSSFEDVERLKEAVAKNGGNFAEGGTRQRGTTLSGNAVLKASS